MYYGAFTNKAVINIGALVFIGNDGIDNSAVFINESGSITIDQTDSNGIANYDPGTFTNKVDITIGGTGLIFDDGIDNSAIFTNESGTISIDDTYDDGIDNEEGGLFTNKAVILIGTTLGIGYDGIANVVPSSTTPPAKSPSTERFTAAFTISTSASSPTKRSSPSGQH